MRTTYEVDPEEDGVSEAARHLLEGEGEWAQLWQRFTEAPQRFRGISRLLREPLTGQGILVDRSRLPLENDEDERRLRDALVKAAAMPRAHACEEVLALEAEHGVRRNWVWRYLDESPYAQILRPLARLAGDTRKGLSGTDVAAIAAAYARDGWRSDDDALSASSLAHGSMQQEVVTGVLRAIYLPWLDEVARQFQDAIAGRGASLPTTSTAPLEPGTCLLFADGLRLDLAARLQASLEGVGIASNLGHRIGTDAYGDRDGKAACHDCC